MSNRTCSIPDCQSKHCAKGLCRNHYAAERRRRAPKIDWTERFFSRLTPNGTCLEWQGHRTIGGYGVVSVKGRRTMAHRHAWEIANGPIPDGAVLDHKCGNRACANVDHLRLSTVAQNQQYQTGLNVRNTSGYRGVRWNKVHQKWIGYFSQGGKCTTVVTGLDKESTAIEVAKARLEAYDFKHPADVKLAGMSADELRQHGFDYKVYSGSV